MVGAANLRQQQKLVVRQAEIIDSSRSQERKRRSARDEDGRPEGVATAMGAAEEVRSPKGLEDLLGEDSTAAGAARRSSPPGCQFGVTFSVRGAAYCISELSKGVCVRIDAPLSAPQGFFERQFLHRELLFCTRIPEFLGSKFETSMSVPTRHSLSS